MLKEGLIALASVFLVGAIVVILFQRMPRLGNQAQTQVQTPAPSGEMRYSIAEVVGHKYVYQDLEMELTGVVRNWIDKRTFVISDPTRGTTLSDPPLMLVVNRSEFRLAGDTEEGQLALGQRVGISLTGTVRVFNRIDVENQLGVDLPDELVRGYENKPFLMVSVVDLPE